MRYRTLVLPAAALLLAVAVVSAQPLARGKDRPASPSSVAENPVERMMAFDKNKDGKLTRDEITDKRLLRLFDRADANKDGVVTREELTALFAKEKPAEGGFGPPGGPGGPGGFGPPGKGGFGPPGKGGFGGPPRSGQILPGFLQDALKLTSEQKKQVDDLQKEVDGKLDQILTADQRKQVQQMRQRGPRGFGPPPGFGPPGAGGRPGAGRPPEGSPPGDRPK
jgi:hypothetical protein